MNLYLKGPNKEEEYLQGKSKTKTKQLPANSLKGKGETWS